MMIRERLSYNQSEYFFFKSSIAPLKSIIFFSKALGEAAKKIIFSMAVPLGGGGKGTATKKNRSYHSHFAFLQGGKITK